SVKLDIKMDRIGSKILEFHNVGKGFDGKNLIEGFSYKFKRFERVGIVGVNGSGKSTLLNMITGSLQPDMGKIVVGDTIKIGYYKQDHAEIKPGLRLIEAVREVADFIRMHKGQKLTAYQLLERFLFSKEKHQQLVSTLSGGERRRLHLMRILMENPNFLILDEPTNDLDLATLNVLEDFLAEFQGILVIVTHDRYFMDRLVDHLFIFEGDGVIRDFPGNYTNYQLALKQEAAAVKAAKAAKVLEKKEAAATAIAGKDSGKDSGKDLSRARKLSYNEQREFKKLGRDIEDLEKEKTKIETELGTGPEHDVVMKLSERMGVIVKELDEKENRWLELSEFV
ncbi:ATP-binding cassette domain-containing protein, partial [Chitinophagales bacterium]|nr:ATP-binding cassette domain-containing protein [Chitinophagales bacterium]